MEEKETEIRGMQYDPTAPAFIDILIDTAGIEFVIVGGVGCLKINILNISTDELAWCKKHKKEIVKRLKLKQAKVTSIAL